MIGRPWTRELHVALAHSGACGCEFVLIALDALAVDEVCDIQDHLAVVHQPATYLFVERQKQSMHLETDGAGASLALAGAGSVFAQVAEIFAADTVGAEMAVNLAAGAVIHEDLEVHFGFAAQLFNVAEELPLVGADGFAQAFVVVEHGAKTEGQHSGMLEAVGDHPGVVDAGLLGECLLGIVLADDHGEVTGGIEKNLVTTDAENGFERNWFAMTG